MPRLLFLLIVLFSLCLISCGDDDDDNDADDNATDDDATDDDATDDDATDDDATDDDATDDDLIDDDTTDDDIVDDDTADDDVTDDDTITDDYENPLCKEWNEDPNWIDDPVNIHCLVEKGEFADPNTPAPETIRVVDWNIERGHSLDEYIDLFQNDPTLSEADVLLLQEVDRYCPRTDDRHVARELAAALAMDYVYGVEFIELNQQSGEHGNAVLSRFPIVGAQLLRHTDFEQWYLDADQPRLGGRMTIAADVRIGDKTIRVASAHHSSGVKYYFRAHHTQAGETTDLLAAAAGTVIWGGDLNTGVWWVLQCEPAIDQILNQGYADALSDLPRDQNWTMPADPPAPAMRLDWIFHRNVDTLGGRVLYEEPYNDLSDHLGIYADFTL
ncbi:MAG TPA: endonuclease/exonuclease/phosphatase family protein [bacterium]|nr:endonuclease/exonuclease/phosphatase family protein [bacterium]